VTANPERWNDLPPPGPHAPSDVIRELGEGLLLRTATPDDVEALAAFNGAVQADPPDFLVDHGCASWTRELMTIHPRASARDFLLVEDTKRGLVASTLCLLSHRVRYGRAELALGQPELVGTRPEYRRRGLVGAQFDVIHTWAEERELDLLVIDGIPGYYRQFGYDMALENGGARVAYAPHLVHAPPHRVREAREDDAARLAELRAHGHRRHLVSCLRDEAFCRFEIGSRDPGSLRRREYRIVEDENGKTIAVLALYPILLKRFLYVTLAEVEPGTAWSAVAPSIFQEAARAGRAHAERDGAGFHGAVFQLGSEHPLYNLARSRLPDVRQPYAWYVRVPDLARFLERVRPTLEARLADSPLAGHTGSLSASLFRTGVRLHFENGRLTGTEDWTPSTDERGDAAFPELSILQLVFGRRSLSELEAFHADCVVHTNTGRALLEALFPCHPSVLDLTD
jgi:hypothetical protein